MTTETETTKAESTEPAAKCKSPYCRRPANPEASRGRFIGLEDYCGVCVSSMTDTSGT